MSVGARRRHTEDMKFGSVHGADRDKALKGVIFNQTNKIFRRTSKGDWGDNIRWFHYRQRRCWTAHEGLFYFPWKVRADLFPLGIFLCFFPFTQGNFQVRRGHDSEEKKTKKLLCPCCSAWSWQVTGNLIFADYLVHSLQVQKEHFARFWYVRPSTNIHIRY